MTIKNIAGFLVAIGILTAWTVALAITIGELGEATTPLNDADPIVVEQSNLAKQANVSDIITAPRIGAVSPSLDDTDASVEWEDANDLDATGDVIDDSHNHVITNIDSFTKANLETQTSDVADFAEADGDIYSGTHDFGTASIEIENNGTLSLSVDGEVGVDTSSDQLQYRSGSATHVLTAEQPPKCATVETLVATDDNVPIIPAPTAITITAVGCRITGTSATVDFEDSSGNSIKSSVSCDTGASMTWNTSSLTNTSFTSGEIVQFDTNGTPSSPGWATICVKYIIDAQ